MICIHNTIPYYITPLHTILYHITSHRITSHHITSYHVTYDHITSLHVTSHQITSYHITSRRITSHLNKSYYIVLCRIKLWKFIITKSYNNHISTPCVTSWQMASDLIVWNEYKYFIFYSIRPNIWEAYVHITKNRIRQA